MCGMVVAGKDARRRQIRVPLLLRADLSRLVLGAPWKS